MSNITSIYQLLTYLQSWSELGANFAVPLEDVCNFFGLNIDDQRIKIAESEFLLDGLYRTSKLYDQQPRLALAQFATWILGIKNEEIESSRRLKFQIFREEFQIAVSENRINPLNGEPQAVGL